MERAYTAWLDRLDQLGGDTKSARSLDAQHAAVLAELEGLAEPKKKGLGDNPMLGLARQRAATDVARQENAATIRAVTARAGPLRKKFEAACAASRDALLRDLAKRIEDLMVSEPAFISTPSTAPPQIDDLMRVAREVGAFFPAFKAPPPILGFMRPGVARAVARRRNTAVAGRPRRFTA